jgi:antitoxin CptB
MTAGPAEDARNRVKRLHLRAWRRGTRELDLVLGRFADAELGHMDGDRLDLFEALLAVEDPLLADWIAGRARPPDRFAEMVAALGRFPGGI